jgi:hypothetical protein
MSRKSLHCMTAISSEQLRPALRESIEDQDDDVERPGRTLLMKETPGWFPNPAYAKRKGRGEKSWAAVS